MKDGAYSDKEKKTLTNLYNNADIDDNVRDVMVDIFTDSHIVMVFADGSVLDVFEVGINVEAKQTVVGLVIVKSIWKRQRSSLKNDLETGLDEDILRTIQFCIQTYPMADDVQDYLKQQLPKVQQRLKKSKAKNLKKLLKKLRKKKKLRMKKRLSP